MSKLDGMDKVYKVLELQDQGYSREEIALELGHGGKTPAKALKNFMVSWGYRPIEGSGLFPKEPNSEVASKSKEGTIKRGSISKFVKKSNTNKDTVSTKCAQNKDNVITQKNECSNIGQDVSTKGAQSGHTVSNTLTQKDIDKLLQLANNFDNIMSNTSSNTFGDIKIIPCKSPTNITVKIDVDVWKKFNKFAKESDFKQQDLLTTAMELLMDNMSQ